MKRILAVLAAVLVLSFVGYRLGSAVMITDANGVNVGNAMGLNGAPDLSTATVTTVPQGSSVVIASATTVAVAKTTAGVLRGVWVTTAGAATSQFSIFDSSTVNHPAAALIGPIDGTSLSVQMPNLNVTFATGLTTSCTFVTQGQAAITYK